MQNLLENVADFTTTWTGKKEKLNPTTLLFLSSVCKGEKKLVTLKDVTWNYEVPSTPDRKGRHTGAKLTLKNKNTANTPSPAIASLYLYSSTDTYLGPGFGLTSQ